MDEATWIKGNLKGKSTLILSGLIKAKWEKKSSESFYSNLHKPVSNIFLLLLNQLNIKVDFPFNRINENKW